MSLRPLPLLRGGPNPLRPCDGCPSRATCRAPCERLAILLGPEELHPLGEFHSTVLSGADDRTGGSSQVDSARRQLDDRFLTPHTALVPREPPGPWSWISADLRPRLPEWIRGLLAGQRRLLRCMLEHGLSVRGAASYLGISRQVAWKTWHRARRKILARIEEELGIGPKRVTVTKR